METLIKFKLFWMLRLDGHVVSRLCITTKWTTRRRPKTAVQEWKSMAGESVSTIQLQRGPTPLHPASIWADQRTHTVDGVVAVVVGVEVVVVEVATVEGDTRGGDVHHHHTTVEDGPIDHGLGRIRQNATGINQSKLKNVVSLEPDEFSYN